MSMSFLVSTLGSPTVGGLLMRATVVGGTAGSMFNVGAQLYKGAADLRGGTRSLTEVGLDVAKAPTKGALLEGEAGAATAASMPLSLGRGAVLRSVSAAAAWAGAPSALAIAAAVGGGYRLRNWLTAR